MKIAGTHVLVLALFAAACGNAKSNYDAAPACPVPLTECAGVCTNTDSDNANCGACDIQCDPGEVCNGSGVCELSCQAGLIDCVGTCIDPNTDREHCGASGDCAGDNAGESCADGFVCDGAGSCTLSCQVGLIDCGGTCIDPDTDRDHCGASGDCAGGNAGDTCPDGHVCDGAGSCALSCQEGLITCGDTCIDPATNASFCGASADCLAENAGIDCSAYGLPCFAGECACVQTGERQPFDEVVLDSASGCWNGNPCNRDTYAWSPDYGQNFQDFGEQITCGGTTACIANVGIATYSSSTICQGVWEVYCDGAMLGTIDTLAVGPCTGTAMTNGCSISFPPMICSEIELRAAADEDSTLSCCGGSSPDSMIVAVSAW